LKKHWEKLVDELEQSEHGFHYTSFSAVPNTSSTDFIAARDAHVIKQNEESAERKKAYDTVQKILKRGHLLGTLSESTATGFDITTDVEKLKQGSRR